MATVILVLQYPLTLAAQHAFPAVPVAVVLAALGAAALLLTWLLVRMMLRTSFTKAVIAWLPTLLAAGALAAVVILAVQPYMLEAFVLASNSMAPTLRGPHHEGRCPHCNGPLVIPHEPARPDQGPNAPTPLAVCGQCWRSSRSHERMEALAPADRFLCNKLLTPRRWDPVVFRPVEDPKRRYVKRVVALPGEEVVIKDGAIWIDGIRQEPPADLAGIHYAPGPEGWPGLWGTPDVPTRLGEDEYFVIGDHVEGSVDSRTWQEGSPGHPPYALLRSQILGVVTVNYWPPRRWHVFR
jgi:signal peptidase I